MNRQREITLRDAAMVKLAEEIVNFHEGQLLNNYTDEKRKYLINRLICAAMGGDISSLDYEFTTSKGDGDVKP